MPSAAAPEMDLQFIAFFDDFARILDVTTRYFANMHKPWAFCAKIDESAVRFEPDNLALDYGLRFDLITFHT